MVIPREVKQQVRQNLSECILFLVKLHHGRAQAISRDEFMRQLQTHGFDDVDERELRETIHDLRVGGNLICSSGGLKGGYWMAAGWEEVEEYLDREVRARALDLLEQEKVLRHAAAIEFGPKPVPHQLELAIIQTAPLPRRKGERKWNRNRSTIYWPETLVASS